jgi:TFIIB-like protein
MLDGEKCIRCKQRFKFEELKVGPDGFGICHACAAQIDSSTEPRRACPVDGTPMDKELVRGTMLIDRCRMCKGVWLDGDELEIIRREVADENFSRAFMLGMFLG